jgi:hypothetical protein
MRFPSSAIALALLVSLHAVVLLPSTVLCQNSTGGYWAFELPGVVNVSSVNLSGVNLTRLGTDTKFDIASNPKPPPGNKTDAGSSGSSDGLSWWAWVLIGVGGLFLVVIMVLLAVFYADIKKYMGYEPLPKTAGGTTMGSQAAGRRIIEVALVHPGCMGGTLGSSQHPV